MYLMVLLYLGMNEFAQMSARKSIMLGQQKSFSVRCNYYRGMEQKIKDKVVKNGAKIGLQFFIVFDL